MRKSLSLVLLITITLQACSPGLKTIPKSDFREMQPQEGYEYEVVLTSGGVFRIADFRATEDGLTILKLTTKPTVFETEVVMLPLTFSWTEIESIKQQKPDRGVAAGVAFITIVVVGALIAMLTQMEFAVPSS